MTQIPQIKKKKSAQIGEICGQTPQSEFRHPHFIAPAHFELREDGTIQTHPQMTSTLRSSSATEDGQNSADEKKKSAPIGEICGQLPSSTISSIPACQSQEPKAGSHPQMTQNFADVKKKSALISEICGHPPRLVFESDVPFIRLYQGNSLDLLDAIYAKYGDAGRFDAIFADPPYFLSNGGITCHAGKMVKVDKGDWDVSRGPELNHEFNTEWLRRCQRVLKPNGTIWVTGTHHVIFSIGYALQQLGYKILNDIAWEKPNPPPNLSCRYF